MEPIPTSIAVGLMTVLGHWASEKPITVRTAVGVAAIALALTALDAVNPPLARAFGILVVTAVAFTHAPKVMAKVNL